jgi:hypothetical protein
VAQSGGKGVQGVHRHVCASYCARAGCVGVAVNLALATHSPGTLAQVRPLDEGGKLRLTRDMTQLEFCVEHLCPVGANAVCRAWC